MSGRQEKNLQSWVKDFKSAKQAEAEKAAAAALVYFTVYDYPIPDERGHVDRQYRIEKVEGDSSTIHREFNCKGLANIEVARLKREGFKVESILTPDYLSLAAQQRRKQELQDIFDESKNTTDILMAFMGKRGGKA